MKDIFKKIIRPLDLREYAPEMETEIQVWVNPPRELLIRETGFAMAVQAVQTELSEYAQHIDQIKTSGDDELVLQESVRGSELGERINELGKAQAGILAELWSQGPEDTHWSLEDVLELARRSADTDPALYLWMRRQTFVLIRDYRAGQKKA